MLGSVTIAGKAAETEETMEPVANSPVTPMVAGPLSTKIPEMFASMP